MFGSFFILLSHQSISLHYISQSISFADQQYEREEYQYWCYIDSIRYLSSLSATTHVGSDLSKYSLEPWAILSSEIFATCRLCDFSHHRFIQITLEISSTPIWEILLDPIAIRIGEYLSWERSDTDCIYLYSLCSWLTRWYHRIDTSIGSSIGEEYDRLRRTPRSWGYHIRKEECIPDIGSWEPWEILTDQRWCESSDDTIDATIVCWVWESNPWFPSKYDESNPIIRATWDKILHYTLRYSDPIRRDILSQHREWYIEHDHDILWDLLFLDTCPDDICPREDSYYTWDQESAYEPEDSDSFWSFQIFGDQDIGMSRANSFSTKNIPKNHDRWYSGEYKRMGNE